MEIVLILLQNHWKSGTYLSCNGVKGKVYPEQVNSLCQFFKNPARCSAL